MGIKRDIKKYYNGMQIPKTEDVIKDLEGENLKTPVKKFRFKKQMVFATGAVAAVAAAVFSINIFGSGEPVKPQTSAPKAVENEIKYNDGAIGENPFYNGKIIADGGTEFFMVEKGVKRAPDSEIKKEISDVKSGATGFKAGTLTGGEIRDLKNWDNWEHTAGNNEILKFWGVNPSEKYSIALKNENDEPLFGAKVKLFAGERVIYEAVTDIYGKAYLFANVSGDAKDKADKMLVETKEGKAQEIEISEKKDYEVKLSGNNPEVKLDLMFVVDTTGSMGDELNFLKVELRNVIENVEKQTGVPIRTSVNFYRDEQDEYVVKYYDFRDSEAEISEILSQQEAIGGGDYPEAVHTALKNAISEHSWSEDESIKLMFLVLDAPPHDTSEVKTEILAQLKAAAQKGIRIIPVAASGANEDVQSLLRSYAILTGGSFVFLDNNSGYGDSHDVPLKPSEYSSEYLNSMLFRIIGEYCGKQIDTKLFEPVTEEPTTQTQTQQ